MVNNTQEKSNMSSKNKGKRSKAELLSLLRKYQQGQISHERYTGLLIKHNLLHPDPMQSIRNFRNDMNAAEFNRTN